MVDESHLHALLREIPSMVTNTDDAQGADTVLEELQRAVQEHERILQRQGALIKRLREELKDVRR